MQARVWMMMVLWMAGLAACASAITSTPSPAPEIELAKVVTVSTDQILPTSVSTPVSLVTFTPISVSPTETKSKSISIPKETSTPPSPIPTPTPLPLKLQEEINIVFAINATKEVFWSPARHELVQYSGCPNGEDTTIQFVNLANETVTEVTPVEVKLGCYASVLWHLSGEYFLFSSIPPIQEGYEDSLIYGWKVNRSDLTSLALGRESYYWGWLKDNIQVSEHRIGTGIFQIGLYDVEERKGISGTSFEGKVKAISNNFVILNEELGYTYNTSTAVLAQELISPEYEGWLFGPYIKFLGKEIENYDWKVSYYSRFASVLPQSDQVLAITWEEPVFEYHELISGTIPANLQLWDVQTNEVVKVLPDGIYGRFSPNGSIIAAMTPDEPYPNLQLFSYPDGQKFLSLSAYAEADYYSAEVFAFTSFSPNGRYFTFFTPDTNLSIYDLETGEFLPLLTAVPATPLWSPDSARFVYTDPAQGLAIYDTRSHTAYPLAETSGKQLSNPRWSFDGAYLSVAYFTENYEWETVILALPSNSSP